jgi:transglutaminase-like putative cysteine protease
MALDPADCMAPTRFVDSAHPAVIEFASRVTEGLAGEQERATALFLAVRDGYRYDPYNTSLEPEEFMASTVVATERNWCVPKSVLLTAACRAVGLPAALGFADVRNHLQSEKLSASMGTDVFAWHGYSLIWVDGAWHKVSSAFNVELCRRFGTKVLEWDGTGDALMHPFDTAGQRHMEYVRDRGQYVDLPLDELLATFAEVYPEMSSAGAGSEVRDEMFE